MRRKQLRDKDKQKSCRVKSEKKKQSRHINQMSVANWSFSDVNVDASAGLRITAQFLDFFCVTCMLPVISQCASLISCPAYTFLFSCPGNCSALCSHEDCFHHGPLHTAGGDPCVNLSINHSYGQIWTASILFRVLHGVKPQRLPTETQQHCTNFCGNGPNVILWRRHLSLLFTLAGLVCRQGWTDTQIMYNKKKTVKTRKLKFLLHCQLLTKKVCAGKRLRLHQQERI